MEKFAGTQKHTLDDERRRGEVLKIMCAGGINAANIIGVIFVLLIMFAKNVFIKPAGFDVGRLVVSLLILFFALVPWLAVHLNKHHETYYVDRRNKFLNIGFAAVVIASILITVPALCKGALLILYFILAGVSLYTLNAWVFFNWPPRES